jgi:hypothetical protein
LLGDEKSPSKIVLVLVVVLVLVPGLYLPKTTEDDDENENEHFQNPCENTRIRDGCTILGVASPPR